MEKYPAHEIKRKFIDIPINETDSEEFNQRSYDRTLIAEFDSLKSSYTSCLSRLEALEGAVCILEDDTEPEDGDLLQEKGREYQANSYHYFKGLFNSEKPLGLKIIQRQGKPCIYKSQLTQEENI